MAAFARSWNDALDDQARQRLRPYLARTIGTAGDGHDPVRAWLCADWLARRWMPELLTHAGLHDKAEALREAEELTDRARAQRALRALVEARRAAQVARAHARAAACRRWSALALQAATDGAREASRSAPRMAGWNAALAAIRAAPRLDIRDAAADAALQAARDACWAAAWSDGPTPRTRLRPVALQLRSSTFELLDRMLPGVPVAAPPVESGQLVALADC